MIAEDFQDSGISEFLERTRNKHMNKPRTLNMLVFLSAMNFEYLSDRRKEKQ
jgi:hypothetical protein